jgi:hypothetical protein
MLLFPASFDDYLAEANPVRAVDMFVEGTRSSNTHNASKQLNHRGILF